MKRNEIIQQITPDLNHKSWEELYRFKQHCAKVSKKIFKQRSFEEFKNRKFYMLKTGMDVYVVWDKEKGGFFLAWRQLPYQDKPKSRALVYTSWCRNKKHSKLICFTFVYNYIVNFSIVFSNLMLKQI